MTKTLQADTAARLIGYSVDLAEFVRSLPPSSPAYDGGTLGRIRATADLLRDGLINACTADVVVGVRSEIVGEAQP